MRLFSFLNKKEKQSTLSEVGKTEENGDRLQKRKRRNSEQSVTLREEQEDVSVDLTQVEIKNSMRTEAECIEFLEENCQQIVDTQKQVANAKIEYQAVCEYLSDVQKIERMPEGERGLLNESAKKIISLTKQLEDYHKLQVTTSSARFRSVRKNEASLMDELKNMRENESYKKVVQNDMRQLEAEKAALQYDYEKIPHNQLELKRLSIAFTMIVISLIVLFFSMEFGLHMDMKLPFILTVAMAAGIMTYIFYEAYQNRKQYALIEQKINRAIQLQNKVKIKYINNTSSLDYSYSKYGVQNSLELEALIKEYFRAKEAERTYASNEDRLQHYEDKVVDILRVHELQDAEVWLHQLSVLLSDKEFKEMQDGLEGRRHSLMEKMDYNMKVKDQCFEHMHMVLEEQPQLKDTLLQLMKKYAISL